MNRLVQIICSKNSYNLENFNIPHYSSEYTLVAMSNYELTKDIFPQQDYTVYKA